MKKKKFKIIILVSLLAILMLLFAFWYKLNTVEECTDYERLEPMYRASEIVIADDARNMLLFYQELFETDDIETISKDKSIEILRNGAAGKKTGLKEGVIYVETKDGKLESAQTTRFNIIVLIDGEVVSIDFRIHEEKYNDRLINYDEEEYIYEYSVYTNVGNIILVVWDEVVLSDDKWYYTGEECFDEEIRQFANYVYDSYRQIEK